MQGIGNQNCFGRWPDDSSSQMSHGDPGPLECDTISRKNCRNGIITRLDNGFTIIKYAILDRFDWNHEHSTDLSLSWIERLTVDGLHLTFEANFYIFVSVWAMIAHSAFALLSTIENGVIGLHSNQQSHIFWGWFENYIFWSQSWFVPDCESHGLRQTRAPGWRNCTINAEYIFMWFRLHLFLSDSIAAYVEMKQHRLWQYSPDWSIPWPDKTEIRAVSLFHTFALSSIFCSPRKLVYLDHEN
jgi:hypothetical protein